MASGIQLTVQPADLKVTPATPTLQVMATVQNRGGTVDQYTISVDGVPSEWYTLPEAPIALFPGEQEIVKIALHPPTQGTKAGTFPLTITATSTADPSMSTQQTATLSIVPIYQFEMDMSPRKVVGRKGRFEVSLRNTGNADLEMTMEGSDPEERCDYRFSPEEIELGSGRKETVRVLVRPRRGGFIGERQEFSFKVQATPNQGAPKNVQGRLVHTPRLRTWKLFRRLGMVITLVVLAAVGTAIAGGPRAVQQKLPGWKANVTDKLCQKANLFCGTPTPVAPIAPTGAGTPSTGGTPRPGQLPAQPGLGNLPKKPAVQPPAVPHVGALLPETVRQFVTPQGRNLTAWRYPAAAYPLLYMRQHLHPFSHRTYATSCTLNLRSGCDSLVDLA